MSAPAGTARNTALLVLLLAGAAGTLYAQDDDAVLRAVNRLRMPAGPCNANAAPLVRRAPLDQATARMAQGAPLEAAAKAGGYRMTEAQIISVSGPHWKAGLEPLLARRFCAQIAKKELADIGVYETRNQLWIVMAAPFAPRVDLTPQQLSDRMLALVNRARAEPRRCGDKAFGAAGPVRWNTTLQSVAEGHANDMAAHDYFSHSARDGSTPDQRVTRAGYRWRMTGENIAAGQLTPEAAVAGWIKSPGHCENLMNAGYTEMGVAAAANASSSMGLYWVQEFGTPR